MPPYRASPPSTNWLIPACHRSLSNTRLEEVFLRLCANTTDLNAGGTGDTGTLTFDDLSALTATEALDVLSELAWTAEEVVSYGSGTAGAKMIEMVQMNIPKFSSDDGQLVTARLGDRAVDLGQIVIADNVKIARDKSIGTVNKPLIAKAMDDGKGTLSIVLPATGLPSSKLCVQVPDLRKIFIEVPMDGTVGEEIYFTAPPPIAHVPTTRLDNVQMDGDELFRTKREPRETSSLKQVYALVAKQSSLQLRQRKSNCCQLCMFVTFCLFGLLAGSIVPVDPDPDSSSASSMQQYTPVWPRAHEAPPTEANTTSVDDDAHRRLQGLPDVQMVAVGPAMFMFCMATMIHLPKFVHTLIEEKQLRLYHSMRLQGVSLFSYWLGVYVYDYVLYLVFAGIFVTLGYIFNVDRFTHASVWRYIGAVLVFGHSQIGLAAFISSLVRSPKLATILSYLIIVSSCIAVVVVNNFITGGWSPFLLMMPTLAYPRAIALTLAFGGGWRMEPDSELARALWWQAIMGTALLVIGVFLHIVLPNEFGMTESHLITQACARLNRKEVGTRLTGEAAAVDEPAAPQLLPELLPKERRSSINDLQPSNVQMSGAKPTGQVDPDVMAEEYKIRRGEISPVDHPIVIDDLVLVYLPPLWAQLYGWLRSVICGVKPRASKLAVGGVSLSMGKGDLFGLLGPNGAGKTSVVNILSGLLVQSQGTAHVGSFDTKTEMAAVHTVLGACPQFDTVWQELTVEEHLCLYARLKGVPNSDERGLVQSVAEAIRLDGDPLRQPAGQLSGGMLRRLSLGIALIADPQVVLLDEPTTGLDPETRRMVWEIVEREREKGRCIVLTTHSMEEADTLCTRIGIMTQGKLRSLGTSTELKRRHGQGFRLSFTLKSEGAEVDEEIMKAELCPTAELIYSFSKSRVYLLPTADTDLPSLFEKLVHMKDSLGVREWGLSQATLEEAFIRIATDSGTT